MTANKLLAPVLIDIKELDKREVSGWISRIEPDEIGDVVLPEGMDDSYYKNVRSLTLYHDSTRPVGVCRTYDSATGCKGMIKPGRGLHARFHIGSTQAGNEAYLMVQEEIVRCFSIEWDPSTIIQGQPTAEETKKYGSKCRNVFRKFTLTGVSLVPQPMNSGCVITEKSIRRLHELIGQERLPVAYCKSFGWPEPESRVVSLPPRRVVIVDT